MDGNPDSIDARRTSKGKELRTRRERSNLPPDMKTEIVRLDASSRGSEEARRLGATLATGALVAFPTETVYGIAAARDDADAVRRLREVKGRPEDKPLTVHVADPADIATLTGTLDAAAARLVARLLPGPVTLVLPDPEGSPTGFRLPDHEIARAFLRAADTTVVATSANRSGEPALTDGPDVEAAFDGRIDAILSAGPTRCRDASTVVRAMDGRVEILREGAVPESRVREAACLTILMVCTGNICRSPMAEGILRHLLAERLDCPEGDLVEKGVRIISAGTAGIEGNPATPPAVAAAAKWGADISDHAARPLTPGLITDSDVLVTAARSHEEVILSFTPEAFGKIRPLRRDGTDVMDPYGRSPALYRRVAVEIREEMAAFAEQVLGVVEGEKGEEG
jgi:tRNA threonylcarbamoyl adenosine modification protein (Sua5/YciO/YrdC/YwlC family)